MDFDSSHYNNRKFEENKVNLIINYLPQMFTDHDLFKTFIIVGPIKTCRIMRDLKTGYSYGFGFVEYEKPDDAAKAIAQLNNLPIQHKRIKVSYARPPSEDIKDTNLYIQHIPRSYSEEQLEAHFAAYGKIVHVNILKDKITGVPRGIGFVRFDKKHEASAAIEGLNGRPLPDGDKPLVVRIAEDHGKSRGSFAVGNSMPMRVQGGGPVGGPAFNRGGNGGTFNSCNQFDDYSGGFADFGRGGYSNNPAAGGKITTSRMGKRFHPMGGNFGGGGGGGGGHFYGLQ